MERLFLGVVGEKRAGKDTFCEHLRRCVETLSTWPTSVHRYSDIVGECLDKLCLPRTRENMQKFSPFIELAYGKGIFSRAMTKRALLDKKKDSRLVIIQGVRWWSDFEELKRLGIPLMYVTADKRIRHQRSLGNSEKPDEVAISWEKFEEQERAETEIYVSKIGAIADFKIENNGDEEEFRMAVGRFAVEFLFFWPIK